MSYLELAKKAKEEYRRKQQGYASPAEPALGVDLTEGVIIAVLIDSPIVGPVWFAFNDNFHSGDNIPVFFASEIPFLRKMTADEIRRRYSEKRELRSGWIRDRINDPTKQ
jgi:hypothetical protein